MIKVIALDLVGVLVHERDINLSEIEDKLERMFGPNKSDKEYLDKANSLVVDDSFNATLNIMNKLYEVVDYNIFKNIKEKYPYVKVVVATNHLSYIRDYINNNFDTNYLDDMIISAEINRIKPEIEFYQYILSKYNIKGEELLFLDDNINNTNSAKFLGINTIKVEKNMNLLLEIDKRM